MQNVLPVDVREETTLRSPDVGTGLANHQNAVLGAASCRSRATRLLTEVNIGARPNRRKTSRSDFMKNNTA